MLLLDRCEVLSRHGQLCVHALRSRGEPFSLHELQGRRELLSCRRNPEPHNERIQLWTPLLLPRFLLPSKFS